MGDQTNGKDFGKSDFGTDAFNKANGGDDRGAFPRCPRRRRILFSEGTHNAPGAAHAFGVWIGRHGHWMPIARHGAEGLAGPPGARLSNRRLNRKLQ